MKKTSLVALGLATALGLAAAAPAAFAEDHPNARYATAAEAWANAPGAVNGWYSGPNPNWRPNQFTDTDGHTHYYNHPVGQENERHHHGDRYSYANRYYNGNGYYNNNGYYPYGYYQRDNNAGILGALLGVPGYNTGY